MVPQLHKWCDDEYVIFILERYISRELTFKQVLELLKIKRARFFRILQKYRANKNEFTIKYQRKRSRKISPELERIIIDELKREKDLILNKDTPLKDYNYTYIRDIILKKYNLSVSVTTIIKRAKEYNFYIPKKSIKKHTREVITHYPGELIQQDSSFHLFSPLSGEKWYLITSIDDYSRFILYAILVKRETSYVHIHALEEIVLRYGIPLRFYVDSHSIFRFVQGRDSIWRNHKKLTDQSPTQFQQVLSDLNIDITYALSPQAKGKIERGYRWLQDRLVRTCVREGVKTIEEARKILEYEVDRYNSKQVHSTTGEIPYVRLEKAIEEGKTMFREFKIPYPFKDTKDIFCLRDKRIINGYGKIKFKNMEIKIKDVYPNEEVEIRIYPDFEKDIAELRFWYKNKFIESKKVKIKDLDMSTFEIYDHK